jgi:hypothetical protein
MVYVTLGAVYILSLNVCIRNLRDRFLFVCLYFIGRITKEEIFVSLCTKQEVLGRTIRLLSFDMAWTAQTRTALKTKKIKGILRSTNAQTYMARIRKEKIMGNTETEQDDLISLIYNEYLSYNVIHSVVWSWTALFCIAMYVSQVYLYRSLCTYWFNIDEGIMLLPVWIQTLDVGLVVCGRVVKMWHGYNHGHTYGGRGAVSICKCYFSRSEHV